MNLDQHKYDYLHAENVHTVRQAIVQYRPGCTCRACKVVEYVTHRMEREYVVFCVYVVCAMTCPKCGGPMRRVELGNGTYGWVCLTCD